MPGARLLAEGGHHCDAMRLIEIAQTTRSAFWSGAFDVACETNRLVLLYPACLSRKLTWVIHIVDGPLIF